MSAYIVAQVKVHDPKTYQRYRDVVTPLVDRFGGRFRIRGGEIEVLEGDWPTERLVVIEFQSRDAARLFYDSPEYQEAMRLRQEASSGTVAIVAGAD